MSNSGKRGKRCKGYSEVGRRGVSSNGEVSEVRGIVQWVGEV